MTNGNDGAVALSKAALPVDTDWRKHIVNTGEGRYALPVGVELEGDGAQVDGLEALLHEGGGVTTLTNTEAGSTRVIVDFGIIVGGYVEVGVRSVDGAPIRVSVSEWREHCGPRGDAGDPTSPIFPDGYSLGTNDDPDGRWDIHEPTAEPTVLRSPAVRGSQRYVILGLEGPGQAVVDFVRVEKTNYQPTYDGHFLCSDDFLTKAWYVDAYSLSMCTARQVHGDESYPWLIVDGGKRDRLVFGIDLLFPDIAGMYLSEGYRKIVRDSLNVFACCQQPDGIFPLAAQLDWRCEYGQPYEPADPPAHYTLGKVTGYDIDLIDGHIPVYGLWWLPDLVDYYRFTGDEEYVRAVLDVGRRLIAYFIENTTPEGLYETGRKSPFERNWHPPDKADGIDAQTNAAYWAGLMSMAYLEREVAGDEAAAKRYEDQAEVVHQALFASHWDDEVGAMVLNTQDPDRLFTSDAQAGPLMLGLFDEDQAARAIRFLDTELASPYGTVTVKGDGNEFMRPYIATYMLNQEFHGRFRYGDGAGALRVARQAWGRMYEFGPGTAWEDSGVDGKPDAALTDANHGWGTLIPVLTGEVLGVKPVGPGYRMWRIAPQPSDLFWAQGEVPTPHGPIAVRWERGDSDQTFVLSIDVAHGTGEVAIPLLGDADRVIAMDGKVVWEGGGPVDGVDAHTGRDSVVIAGVGAGQHTFAWA